MKVKSYIKDTNDFLHKVIANKYFEKGTLLVTMASLYTNIPNKEGLTGSMQALEKHRTAMSNPGTCQLSGS